MGDNIITSYTQTQAEAYILDISEVLDLIRKTDIKLLGQISIGGVATQKKHSWLKDEMDYEKVQATNDAAGALVIGETTLTLNLAGRHDLRLRVGSIIKDKAVGKDESLMVTNIATVSPYTITVTVWPGGGAAGQDHAQAADYRIISSPIKEGASPTDSAAAARTMASNYIQLFERGISITDETKNLKMKSVSDEEKYQIEKKTWSLKRELGFAVLYGKQHEPASVDEYGTLGGILEFLSAAGSLVSDAGGAELTEKMINDRAQAIADEGGTPDIIVVGTKQARLMSTFSEKYIRTQSTQTVLGHYVDTFLTDTGLRLPIIIEDELDTEYAMLLTKGMAKIVPFNNEAWSLYVWPRTKYAQTTTMKGAYTFELRNADKCHALIKNLAEPELS